MHKNDKSFLLQSLTTGGYQSLAFKDWYSNLSESDRLEARQLVDEVAMIHQMLSFIAGCEDQDYSAYSPPVVETSITHFTEAKSVLAKFTLTGQIK